MSRSARTEAGDKPGEIATLRIALKHTRPPIWRRVEAPTSLTLLDLHHIIQASVGWTNSHLFEFAIGGRRYGLPMDDGWGDELVKAAADVRLKEVWRDAKTRIEYVYDFGDYWEHTITVSDVRPAEPGVSYPRYIAGKGNGPPEDCGGLPGFYEMLDARADPSHPEHGHIVEWLGDYDPDVIDVGQIQAALARIAPRRKGVKARGGEWRRG